MIYINNLERTVYLDVPVVPLSGTIDVFVKDGLKTVHEVATVIAESDGRLSFVMPFSLTQSDHVYTVNWKFAYSENSTTYEYDADTQVSVVTPILSARDIKKIIGADAADEEVWRIEEVVRYIIQAHTGQFFGKFIGSHRVPGSGEQILKLPSRLISLTSINDNTFWSNTLGLRGSGWYLKSRTYGVPSIRADFDGWHENPYVSEVPITSPYSKNSFKFIKDTEYNITGIWGWNAVPEPVQEAARILINDYSCGDSAYRDRFLTSMTAADWRIQFHEAAFSNTGNVKANQLLSKYVVQRGWVVI